MRRPCLIFIGLVLAVALGWSASAEAATYWVSATGGTTQASCAAYTTGSTDPGFYLRTVQAGINCATTGTNTVQVKTGTYNEAISISGKSNLTITGQGGTPQITSTTNRCFDVIGSSSNVTIQALNIGPCGAAGGGGNGNGFHLTGSVSGIKIYDNYIHTEQGGTNQLHVGIFIERGVSNTDIQGNVLAFSESLIGQNANGGTGAIVVPSTVIRGNYGLNPMGPFPRGQFIYLHGLEPGGGATDTSTNTTNGVIQDNFFETKTGQAFTADTEDFINIAEATDTLIQNNWLRATGGLSTLSTSGCYFLTEFFSLRTNLQANILVNGGPCGIGLAGGVDHVVNGNLGLNTTVGGAGWGPVGIYVHNYNAPEACSGHDVTNNVMAWQCASGSYNCGYDSNYQTDGSCGSVVLTGNNFNGSSAFTALNPMETTHPPPLIPPVPKNCVAVSPFSTQTGTSCSAAGDLVAPGAPTNLRVVSP